MSAACGLAWRKTIVTNNPAQKAWGNGEHRDNPKASGLQTFIQYLFDLTFDAAAHRRQQQP
jgi:hypothetical protein